MPCDTYRKPQQTLAERTAEIDAALRRLEQQLLAGQVNIVIGQSGAVAFTGWNDRDGVTDACAYRTLSVQNSWALRQTIARVEAQTGRKVNPQAIATGLHSHDGGRTWNTH